MASRRLVAIAALLGPMGAVGGCSLVNSFDDVKPLTSGDDAGEDSGSIDSSFADHAQPPVDAAADTTDEGIADVQIVDSAGDVDAGPPAPTGAIVVAATVTSDAGAKSFFLSVLDPKTGLELGTREAMNVAGIRYDGLRDLWYIFENKGIGSSPAPTDKVDLHVRTLDTHSGAWTESQKISVPPLVANSDIAPLRDRLVYVAYTVSDAGIPGYELAVVDTSTPSAVTVQSSLTLASPPTGMTGTRSPSGAGGSVNLVYLDTTACQGDGGSSDVCAVNLLHVNVLASSAPVVVATKPLGSAQKIGGSVAGASWLGGGPDDIFAFPPTLGNSGYIEHFSPLGDPTGQKVNFPVTGPFLIALAVAECWNMALVTELKTDQEIFGIPFSGGTVIQKGTGHANQGLRFEPYTNTALIPFVTGGGHELTAFALTGTPSAPLLAKRTTGWTPPADLEPGFVEVKQPVSFVCQ